MRYDKQFLKNLYTSMLRIRLAEESFVDPILRGDIRTPVHLYTGEEAVAVGISENLTNKDFVFGTHRSHGHYLSMGGNMKAMVAEIYGKETGCARGRGGSMHVVDTTMGFWGAAPIVAGTVSLALGAALGIKIRKQKHVAVSYFGDGAAGEGTLHEAMNFAALNKLPIIFACENNFYSTHLPIRECRAGERIHELAIPYKEVHADQVDGNDVLAVYEAAKHAAALCRSGKGPVFLEFLTYRQRGHVGPDDNIQGSHTDIRPAREIEEWKGRDPLRVFQKFLARNSSIKAEELDAIEKKITKEVQDAHKFAAESAYPDPSELSTYVFK